MCALPGLSHWTYLLHRVPLDVQHYGVSQVFTPTQYSLYAVFVHSRQAYFLISLMYLYTSSSSDSAFTQSIWLHLYPVSIHHHISSNSSEEFHLAFSESYISAIVHDVKRKTKNYHLISISIRQMLRNEAFETSKQKDKFKQH